MGTQSRGIYKVEECKWIQPDRKKQLRDFPFYDNRWIVLVEQACQKWQLDIACDANEIAWLGHGAHGDDIHIREAGDDRPMALKDVKESSLFLLSHEKAMIYEAAPSL